MKRYVVQFTPVGWMVIDTVVANDPIAQFGTSKDEYKRAKDLQQKIEQLVADEADAAYQRGLDDERF